MLLDVSGVSKRYRSEDGWFTALDDAHVAVDAGQIVGLIGSSGSGKSTLARVVVGLETADAGTMQLDGVTSDLSKPLRKRTKEQRKSLSGLQMVFQHPAASFSARMRILEGVAEGVAYRGHARGECEGMALDALEQVGLPRSYVRKYAWELSGGECQRAALARAIVGGPKLLVCDEPTSALDVTVQAQIVDLIARLCAERGMACLFISHDLALVRNLCSRAYVIDAGAIVEEGPVSDLFQAPKTQATKRLLASIATF
jgi:peptide/nickel transport system ATP-binding protein